jgi:hypothetical protein
VHRRSAEEGDTLSVTLPDYASWRQQIKCQEACPVHTDARGYVCAIADGDLEQAYVIGAGVAGLTCAHDLALLEARTRDATERGEAMRHAVPGLLAK